MGWLGNMFGAKSAPGEVIHAPFRSGEWPGLRGASGVPQGYRQRVEEVFRDNPVGHRAVRLLSRTMAGLRIEAEGEEGARALSLTRADGLLESIAVHLLLHGNAYLHLRVDAYEKPVGWTALRPERVSIATDAKGYAASYAYRVGGNAARYAARDGLGRMRVAHVRALDPADDHYGTGCLEAAILPAAVHNEAARWNRALLANAARPSGALVHEAPDGMPLSDQQFDRLKKEITEQFEGPHNAGRPMLLDGGLRWSPFGMSPADMDFIRLKEAAARDIALAFGVPPVLLGLPGDSTYNNIREAGRALYRQSVLPMARQVLGAMETQLSDWLGPVRLKVDEDALSELSEDRARLWDEVGKADFLTDAEKRQMLGFAPNPDAGIVEGADAP